MGEKKKKIFMVNEYKLLIIVTHNVIFKMFPRQVKLFIRKVKLFINGKR